MSTSAQNIVTLKLDLDALPIPVFGTQGGGLVVWSKQDDAYVWFQVPDPNLGRTVQGAPMPQEWGLIPANEAARMEMDDL